MIIEDNIKVKVTSKNVNHYKIINKDINVNDIITIKPENLPETSKHKIKVQCDICGKIKNISFYSYKRNINKYNYYSCSQKCSLEKNKKTNMERYGVDSYTKTEEYKIKTKNTKKEKYGNDKYINIIKMKKTCLKKYGKETYMSTDDFKNKSKNTLLKKYGVEYPLQSNIIKEKMIKTNLSKYNVKYVLQNDDIKEKIKNTKLKKYNDLYYNNRDQYKKTCIELFGVDNPMKNKFIKNKLKNIIYEKYGVYHIAQLPEYFNKMLKSGLKIKKYNNEIYYQGSYEKDFLDKYYDKLNIIKCDPIKYIFDNKEHFYYPDFYIKELNLIIEIKSTRWFNEHKNKNISKMESCKNNGYNFIFIIDKNYEIFNNMTKFLQYNKTHAWQYDIRLNTIIDDKKTIDFDFENLKISDFEFKYIHKDDKLNTKEIIKFIKKYEWLGKMPNRPTHRFITTYNGILSGVVIMSTPNSFSELIGKDTNKIEKLISRGACASWTPKNLASSLIMFSIKWMSKNTDFKIFTAYADPEAKELGTIYQACNFTYLGNNYGSNKVYFDPEKPHLGWGSSRNFRKLNQYKKYLNSINIKWDDSWNLKTKIIWDKIPEYIVNYMKNYTKNCIERCYIRKTTSKHKYMYILGKDKKETKYLKKEFIKLNPKINNLKYPKNR